MIRARLVQLSGNDPESLGAAASAVTAVVSAIVTIVSTATSLIVTGVSNKRNREAAATAQEVSARIQANAELDAAKIALEQRNAQVQSGYAQLLKNQTPSAAIKKYGPALGVLAAVGVGCILVGKK